MAFGTTGKGKEPLSAASSRLLAAVLDIYAMQTSEANGRSELSELRLPSFHLPLEARSRGALLFDTHDIVTRADPNVFSLLGLNPEDVLGSQHVRDILKDRFANPEAYLRSSASTANDPHATFEDVLELAGQDCRAIHRYSAPLFDTNGDCRGRIEIYSDISKRRELEQSARHAYQELKAAQEQLVQAEKLRAIGEIASGVAHDFNNTLGIILGNVQLLLRSTEDENARARLAAAERAALDGVETVHRIREFTRTEPESEATPIGLTAIAHDVVEMTRPVWQEQNRVPHCNISVNVETSDEVLALANAPEIREVIINIVLNAVQAMPDGGCIRISTGCSAGKAWIQIADTGIGMAEEVRSRIFDPFFTTRGVEGSGLGMSVAYGIITRHGGSISVDSEPGRGTVVTVFLPAATGTAGPDEPEVRPEPEQIRQAKILVVDDEEMFAEVLVEMLTECGHTVLAARSGAEAVEMFMEEPFDMVFTDFGMPHMSGLQLARALKGLRPETPVALLTGWGAALDDGEMAKSAVDIAIAKPVSFEKLSSVVAEALEGRERK